MPQLREQGGEEMETFLRVYADTKVQIILDQDGLEGGISIPEENTEDENEDDDDGGDDDDDPEEDSEHTKDSGNNNEDEDNACEECKKEQFFDFVFEAEEFLNPEYKEMMEEYVEECKNDYKENWYDNENTEDLHQDVNEVIDDLHECSDDFEEHGENCFKSCTKRKIMSITNMANALMDPKNVQKLKQFNARDYRSSQKKLGFHSKLISKLANPKGYNS